ncbi:hypothetical protein L596_018602 [Steinernema carpocapsae]|uniref:Uncharacterized protein n=1 Tax=Steinernema carpocapsae TaxID=34508 RepID=A0A4V6A247_STECR|nr:hypothetical protein L596_018602 [Steinernema carpocapsae]
MDRNGSQNGMRDRYQNRFSGNRVVKEKAEVYTNLLNDHFKECTLDNIHVTRRERDEMIRHKTCAHGDFVLKEEFIELKTS